MRFTIKILALLCCLPIFALIACSQPVDSAVVYADVEQSQEYRLIDASAAYQMMLDYPDAIVLDVRTNEEFSLEHIPGAKILPYDEIYSAADGALPDKDALILIYCRSGRRSAIAAEELASMGYTRAFDFGGIIDWPYETAP